MMSSRVVTGPQVRPCVFCKVVGMAPQLLPYIGQQGGRYWAHEGCEAGARAKRVAAAGPLVFPERHEANDGQ